MSHLFSSAAAASPAPTRYILLYDYIPDVVEKRGPFRDGHLGLAKSMVADGTCISGGPTLPPGEGVPNGGEFQKGDVLVIDPIQSMSHLIISCMVTTTDSSSIYIHNQRCS